MQTALLIVGSLVALGWTALAIRFFRDSSRFRFLKPIPWSGEGSPRSVDIVVPAHNEERDVANTARDLLAQDYPGASLTVVNDQSTDATGAILDRLKEETGRLNVIHGIQRPAGWVGKTWALHQGVAGTSGEWILFVDGDMRLHPSALSTAVATAEATGAELVSFVPKGECRTLWQISVALTLGQVLAQLYPLSAVNDPKRPESLAAGGFILVKRSAYLAVGGHESVRSEIVEDILLSRKFKAAGKLIRTLPAPGLASTHMYGDFRAIFHGLRKNAYAGMDYMPHKFVGGVIAAIVMGWASWAALIAGAVAGSVPLVAVGAWGILAQAAASVPNCFFLGISPAWGFSLPIGISVYVGIASASVLDYHSGRIYWKDRTLQTKEIFAAAGAPDREP